MLTSRFQIIQQLAELAKQRCQESVLVEEDQRIDLADPCHIHPEEGRVYKPSTLIRLTFQNVDDLKTLRREISTFVSRHTKAAEDVRAYVRQCCGEANTFKDGQMKDGSMNEIKKRISEDPKLLIRRELEGDVGYVARVCIDIGIRCGKWYIVKLREEQDPLVRTR